MLIIQTKEDMKASDPTGPLAFEQAHFPGYMRGMLEGDPGTVLVQAMLDLRLADKRRT